MGGNVSEWISDWYGPYDPADTEDPVGPEMGATHVRRGGAWSYNNADFIRSTSRVGAGTDSSSQALGFRCVYPNETP